MTKKIEEGAKAPSFTIALDNGETVKSSTLRGSKVVLYFYPKDDTPGCTVEAIDFSANKAKFTRAGATVIGVSRDSVSKHEKFKKKHGLKIDLGADEDGKVTEDFGVWVEKKLYGRKFMGIERSTFLIDEKGAIRKIWRKVKVAGHADDVLRAVKDL